MKAWNAPFEPAWIGTSLGIAGLADIRPDLGTYGQYALSPLPQAPADVESLEWLRSRTAHAASIRAGEALGVHRLRTILAKSPHSLPHAFEQILTEPNLLDRIRSCTDCYVDLGEGPIECDAYPGFFLPFLRDSQSCVLWYLYVQDGDHCVVASPSDLSKGASPLPPVHFVAESFATFLWHFCLENEAWYAGYDKQDPDETTRDYIDRYRERGRSETSFPEQVRLTTHFDQEHELLNLSIFVVGEWANNAVEQIIAQSLEPMVEQRYDGTSIKVTRLASSEGPPVVLHIYALAKPPRYLASLMQSLPSGATALIVNCDAQTSDTKTIVQDTLARGCIVASIGREDPRLAFQVPEHAALLPMAGNPQKDALKAVSNTARAMLVVMSSHAAPG